MADVIKASVQPAAKSVVGEREVATSSGIPVKTVYRAEELGEFDAAERWGSRGSIRLRAGFSRRCIAGGCGRCGSTRGWAMPRSRIGDISFCWRKERDERKGGLSVAFDLPTQIGYDSDSPMALGEVGKVGVAIDSIEDMERLFAGIPLDTISTSMTINATASILLALYVAVAKRQGRTVKKLSGTVQNDILKEYIARGTYIYPVRHAMRLVTDIFAWAAEEMPEWNTISISGYHMREAGCTAVQEVAFTLAEWHDVRAGCDGCGAGGGCVCAAAELLLQRA